MVEHKLVSVGIPVYNEAYHIRECLESVVCDSYPGKEIIISDNGSTDGTIDIIEEFKRNYDKLYNIRFIEQDSNIGAVENFKEVFLRSNGDYFIWIGAHDIWGPGFVEGCVDILEKNKDVALVMPLVKWIDEESNVIDDSHVVIDTKAAGSPAQRVLALINQWEQCTAIYGVHRKSVLMRTMPWPRTLGSDNIALIRIAAGGHIVSLRSAYYLRRARETETSEETMYRQLRAMKVQGVAYEYARVIYRWQVFRESHAIKGPVSDRIKLIKRALRDMVATMLRDMLPSVYSCAKKVKNAKVKL